MSLLRLPSLTTRCFISKTLLSQPTFTAAAAAAAAYSTHAPGGAEKDREPLRKAKTPVGKFDVEEKDSKTNDPFQKFPDDVNPYTKEKGGPRGPEPTRYGDWERKGRCIDF